MNKLMSMSIKFVFALALAAACSLAAQAQTVATQEAGRVQLESLDRLAPKAVETVNVQVDESLLSMGIGLLSTNDPEEKNIKEAVAGLKGVYVRVLGFKGAGEYADADIEPIRAQLRSPAWTRIVGVQSRKEGLENAEVYLSRNPAGRVDGLAFVAFGPKQIVLVNLVGLVDLEKLRRLEGNLGIPEVNIGGGSKTTKGNAPARKKP
jgi:hypothetical protein